MYRQYEVEVQGRICHNISSNDTIEQGHSLEKIVSLLLLINQP